MPRFFVPDGQIADGSISIVGDDAWHIARSLRMAVGDALTVCAFCGDEYACKLEKITDGEVIARILSKSASGSESPVGIVLYQAFPKGDKMDSIVQKAVECGVRSVVPFLSSRCIARPEGQALARKGARWQRIADEAAKQCGRGFLPQVSPSLSFDGMLDAAADADLSLFCYEGDGTVSLRRVLSAVRGQKPERISLVIGSEGGFSVAEAQAAAARGFSMCSLGPRILRCESAPAFALACIAYEFELTE
ncbi:MAG: 16S rRNA (uracil(1498)-N(3))-methyltransferase [Clostridia bacterium]|nr:16S rRNA (uracil(1498)-N(3))-methyltransferase [Clostridia bacterium]